MLSTCLRITAAHQLASPERSNLFFSPCMSGTSPHNESVLGGTGTRPLLTSGTPEAGTSHHTPPTPDMFKQFFTQHSAQLQKMFTAQFSPRRPHRRDTPQGMSKRHLDFPSRSPSADRSSRSKTPPETDRERPYVHRTRTGKGVAGTPFVRAIANFATPHDFKIPANIKLYDGTTDPDDHLNTYVNTMNIYAPQMPIWCKVFPATLTDKACFWFEKLPPGSISSYEELEQQFRAHFSQMKRFQKTKAEFMAIRQGESEPLGQFITRFNSESLQLADRSEDFPISAFINGLRHGKLATSFPPFLPLWRTFYNKQMTLHGPTRLIRKNATRASDMTSPKGAILIAAPAGAAFWTA